MLDQGLNPQWLAMEGSRLLDEKRHAGESVEIEEEESIVDLVDLLGDELAAEISEESAPAASSVEDLEVDDQPAVEEKPTGPPLFLVDDDQLTAQVVARQMRDLNLDVSVFTSSKDYLKALESAVANGAKPYLLIDLIMPKLDGSGISGGIEVVKIVREKYPDLVIMLMSDQVTSELEQKLVPLNLGALVLKPKKSHLGDDQGKQVLAEMAQLISQVIGTDDMPLASAQEVVRSAETGINFGAELLEEVNDAELQAKPTRIEPTPGIHLLGGMLQELNNPALGGGIILLVLRFASELMNRAVIFFVKADEIVGLGQFGLDLEKGNPDDMVRRIKVPTNVDSIFQRALQERTPKHTAFGEGEWDNYLVSQLGGERPNDIFVGPILSEGSVVAVIYGDNLPEHKPVGDTESLEIFLSQAGMAMERALLERRMKDGQAV